ncbi:ImuA family protein [Paracoccus fontiphilus]|uniref:ImuA family protein n=1 Tax=Paracoccus fontiphilus TaxID=1815556 RepID=A0ABV7IGX6_9RHOB|nr:hypothetical protein [Paracoccus fontiphilus]
MPDRDLPTRPASFPLRPARMHEVEGAGRRVFALYQALHHPGPLFWFLRAHEQGVPFLWGLPPGIAARLYLVHAASEADLLWTVEEALRSPAAGLVVAEPQEPLSLTAGRRMQLAAEAGRTTAIMLIRQGAGCNAGETRWHCRPLPSSRGQALHEWRLLRDKRGVPKAWVLDWNGRGPDVAILSEATADV